MVLTESSIQFIDVDTGCQWYITWDDNDEDGLTSVDDGYEIRTDKIDAQEKCALGKTKRPVKICI